MAPRDNRNPAPSQDSTPGPEGVDRRFARHYWRTGRRLLGHDTLPDSWQGLDYDDALASEMVARLRLETAFATFGDRVSRGEDHDTAHVATIRALIASGNAIVARSYSLGLGSGPDDRLTRLGLALCLHHLRRHAALWEQVRSLDADFLARHAPVEASTSALMTGTPDAAALAEAIAADPAVLTTSALTSLAGRHLVAGERATARRLYEEARRRDDADEAARNDLENLARWLSAPGAAAPEPTSGRVRVGIFDYHHPELVHAAGNIGDHIQTLALLGNLARFGDVAFHGADGLGEFAGSLQGRVRDELRLEGPAAEVELFGVSRDYSEGDPIPEDTWLVAFGWHMHALYKIRFGLPYHPHLRPIFVAFHLNRTQALTPEAIEYLRAHGPIGCRDWTTVDLLLSAGVDAFFTGCLTTTVNAVFPERQKAARDVVAAIDVPAGSVKAKRQVETVTHLVESWHRVSPAEGLRNADELLRTYQDRYHRIVTSRLHSYLPATSLGVPVTFRPNVPGDVRFAGLDGMEPEGEAFVAMRDGIRELLAETFARILAGDSPEHVYAHWRDLTSARVREARARLTAPATAGPAGFDVAAAVAGVRSATHRHGPHDQVDTDTVTDVAVSLDANYRQLLPVTLESLVANARGPLRVFVTARGLDEAYRRWLSAAFPEVPFTFLDNDTVEYGPLGRMIGHVSVATMDRLLLPDVLPDVDRITYVDIDTVTLGDVTDLARTDLGGHPLAARTEHFSAAQTWRAAGDNLSPEDAYELRRTMQAAHGFDFRTFNAGVMVLDLARMRQDRFVERFVPMATRFGLHDQDVLNAYAGPGRAELDPAWHTLPVLETVEEPRLVHFAGAGKPWQDRLVPGGRLWREYADRVAARVGEAP